MPEYLETKVDGKTIYIELDRRYGSEETANLSDALGRVEEAFEDARDTIMRVSQSLAKSIASIDNTITPNQFQLEFGIKFDAQGTVMLASASAGATISVTMTYEHKKDTQAASASTSG